MEPSWLLPWFPIFVVYLVLFLSRKKKKQKIVLMHQKQKKRRRIMEELAKRFLGKDCYITLLDGTADGVLREVSNGGLILEKKGKSYVINLDYVVKISEYAYNKKGKRSLMGLE